MIPAKKIFPLLALILSSPLLRARLDYDGAYWTSELPGDFAEVIALFPSAA